MDIYRSENGTAFLDPRGFLEIVIAKHSMFTLEEGHVIATALISRGISEVAILISRINEYAVPPGFNVLDLSGIGDMKFTRVAVYAPSPGDRTFSQLMGMTAFKNVPYQVFSVRDEAIAWLIGAD